MWGISWLSWHLLVSQGVLDVTKQVIYVIPNALDVKAYSSSMKVAFKSHLLEMSTMGVIALLTNIYMKLTNQQNLIIEKSHYADNSQFSQSPLRYSRNSPISTEAKFALPCVLDLSLDHISNKLNEVHNPMPCSCNMPLSIQY